MIRIDFDGIFQKYSKVSRIEFVCFSFHVGLLFINFSSFKSDTENIANFYTVSSKRGNWRRSIKKTNFNLQECKGYNTRQFITELLNKGGTKNSINRLVVTFGTVDRRPGSGRRSTAHTDEYVDTVESLLMSQEDKPQSHRTVREISREAGGPSIISFADYSQRSASNVLQEKARSTADWSTQHAHVIFGMQFERW